MPPKYPNINGGHVIGRAVAKLQISNIVSVEVDEPDPSKISPNITVNPVSGQVQGAATMQGFVASLHALQEHHKRLGEQQQMIVQVDQVIQMLVHTVTYLARRVKLLETEASMGDKSLPLQRDVHEPFVATHLDSLEELAQRLRQRVAEETLKQGLSDNTPS